MTPIIIVILAVLLIIGIVRSAREKAQSEQVKDSPVQEQEETPYQISQESDQSNYQEVYSQPEVEVKKASVKKEAPAKKATPKKPTAKKAPTKKSTK
jgi:competence protein ComGC